MPVPPPLSPYPGGERGRRRVPFGISSGGP